MGLLWVIFVAVIIAALGFWVVFATTSLILHILGYILIAAAVIFVLQHLFRGAHRGPGGPVV